MSAIFSPHFAPDADARSGGHSGPGYLAGRLRQVLGALWKRLWAAVEASRAVQKRRSLRVVETVAMGEKRFVAIVQVEEARFLVGGGNAGVTLLARLDATPHFAAVLEEQAAPVSSTVSPLAADQIREAW